MHTFLTSLQTAETDQLPVVAGLLLQLDLLVRLYPFNMYYLTKAARWGEPRKISIYREEAIDTFISCLKCSDLPATQIAASDTILALQGRISSSEKPLV
ncbi:hypothetical protein Tco_0633697 [Tanacetum coccineum]